MQVQLTKVRMGQDFRQPKYLTNAKNKALAIVNDKIFYGKKGEIQISAINICVAAKLPGKLKIEYISQIAKNLLDIRAKMELK